MWIIRHNIGQNPYKTLCFCTPRRALRPPAGLRPAGGLRPARRANLGPAGGLAWGQRRKNKIKNDKK